MNNKIPLLLSKRVCIIKNREKAIINTVTKIVPDATLLLCWNHIRKDVKIWLELKDYSSTEIHKYTNDIYTLLEARSKEDCDELMDALRYRSCKEYQLYRQNGNRLKVTCLSLCVVTP